MPAVLTTYTLTDDDLARAAAAGVLRAGQKAGDKVPVVSTGKTDTTIDTKDDKTGAVTTKPVTREHGTAFLIGGGVLAVTLADTDRAEAPASAPAA